jgi:putative endopeptidase
MSIPPTYGDDFFTAVNYLWLKNNPIPDDYSRWGVFNKLRDDNLEKLEKILLTLNTNNRLGILYHQGINRRNNINEIFDYIDEFQNTDSIESLLNLVVEYLVSWGIKSPFNFSVHSDLHNADMNILHLCTGGLGLPDKDYYFDPKKENIRKEYKIYLNNLLYYFELDYNIDDIYSLEEELANVTYTKVEKRDPKNYDHATNITDILYNYPSFNFIKHFFTCINKNPEKINICNPRFFKKLNELFTTKSLKTWKNYFVINFLQTIKNYLSIELEEISFNFYNKIISGTKTMLPINKRVIINIENQLGELLGEYYVKKHFCTESKSKASEMISYLKNELKNKLINLDWMEEKTKKKALLKLDTMKVKVGYPDNWRKYKSNLNFNNSYLFNNLLCNKDDNEFVLNKLYKPIDRAEWHMNAFDVNAYYSPSFNEIVFPAGILQKPFFCKNDDAMSYGGIGSIIGHEMTHGFDDQGCKYDHLGNLNNWWTDTDRITYDKKTKIIEEQYNNYQIEGINLNGKLTLGENIADIGGVSISLDGFKHYLSENKNLTHDNLKNFFISYARIWAGHSRREEAMSLVVLDPHSPPEFRVNGVVKNIDDFYTIFDVNENNKLFISKENRAEIW